MAMNECCKQNLRAAAEAIEGAIPNPFSVACAGDKKKAIEGMKPMVAILFHLRDKVLKMIPEDPVGPAGGGPVNCS